METKPVWKRNKVWMVLIGVAGVLGVALGGAAIGLDDESRAKAIDAVLWLVGLLIGGHTLTDVGSQVAKAAHHRAEAEMASADAATIRAEAEMVRARNGHGEPTAEPAPTEPPDMEPVDDEEADDEG